MMSDKWQSKWDQRYAAVDYVFGRDPNAFLVRNLDRIPAGKVLCAGDGEGRNGVWLALQGFNVTALDYSRKGLEKARKLAEEFQVEINFIMADILEVDLGWEQYDAIINIFLHFDKDKIPVLHKQYLTSLKPGGIFLAEVYSKDQLKYNSGGPKSHDALYEPDYYHRDFPGWKRHYLKQELIELDEGNGHNGRASVIRAILEKPDH